MEPAEDQAAVQRECALLEELSVSWESLDALYELNSDLRRVTDSNELLRRLLARASAIGISLAGGPLSVALFEKGPGGFTVWMTTDAGSAPAGGDGNWIAALGGAQGTHVLNGNAAIRALGDIPDYLQSASCLVVAPVATRQGGEKVLGAWSGQARLETPAVRLMEAFALHAAMIEEGDRLRSALHAQQRMERDLEIGAAIQSMLLVEPPPSCAAGIDTSVCSVPSQNVDGDFHDFFAYPDGTLDIVVGDVMGKGVAAALVGAATKSALLRSLGTSGFAPVAGVVTGVARRLCHNLIELERFVTLVYARLDGDRRRLTFVDCGHTGILHYRAASGRCAHLRGVNMPVGFSESDIYQEATAAVEPGDVLLFYSDGVTETCGPDGELYGEPRLGAVVEANARATAAAINGAILRDTAAFGARAHGDDLTCVTMKIEPLRASTAVRNDLNELSRLRGWFRAFVADADLAGYPDELVDSVELALTEAVSNVIRHAYTEKPAAFEITLQLDGHSLCIAIRHNGAPMIDPASVPEPQFDGSRSGGFGLLIIRSCVDEMQWGCEAQGFQVMTLTKYRKGDK